MLEPCGTPYGWATTHSPDAKFRKSPPTCADLAIETRVRWFFFYNFTPSQESKESLDCNS